MRKLFLILALLFPSFAHAQGSLLPFVEGSFIDSLGVPVASGFVCATLTGTAGSNLATYPTLADANAGTNANSNPVALDSAGRANIFIGTGTYRIVLLNPVGIGSGTCNNTPTGSAIKTVNGVSGFGSLLAANNTWTGTNTFTGTTTINALNGRQSCVTGATADLKAIAALAALPSTGGVADCTNLQGAQTLASQVVVAANKTLLLGDATLTCTFAGSPFSLGANAQIIGLNRDVSIIAQNSTCAPYSTVLVTGNGGQLRDFSISGSVPSGQEGSALSAITFSKSTQLTDVTIENVYIAGTNGGIYADTLTPAGNARIRLIGNKIRTLHCGICIGPYAGPVVNDTILVDGNDIQVTAAGSYSGFQNARPLQVLNTNNLKIVNNYSFGGFAGIETYGNTGNPSMARPHQKGVIIEGNHTDSFISFIQITGGSLANNVIDMALRPAGFPAYDNATVVVAYGYLPGIEASDNIGVAVTGNTVRSPVGPGIDFSSDNSTLVGNDVYNANNTATPNTSYSGCILLDYTFANATVADNSLDTCKLSGIQQIGTSQPASTLTRLKISGNTITATQRHGIHLRSVIDSSVSNNIVNNPNLVAGAYNAIDFTDDGGGAANQVIGVTIASNITSGGVYGVNQPYTDAASNRKNVITQNTASGTSTSGFNVYGVSSLNRDYANYSGVTVVVGAGTAHLSVTGGTDTIFVSDGGTGAKTFGFLDNGSPGDIKTVYFLQSDITVAGSGNLILAAGPNPTPTATSTMTFLCIQNSPNTGQQWNEIARTIH